MTDLFQELKEQVFFHHETLRDIYNFSGNLTLKEYVKTWQVTPRLQPELAQAIKEELEKIHEPNLVKAVLEQLAKTPLVSTIDHHGIVGHPFFLNSNLIFSLYKNQKFLICLSTSGVSLNNSSLPASLVFNQENEFKKINLFSEKQKMLTVFAAPGISKTTEEKVVKKVQTTAKDYEYKKELQNLVKKIFLELAKTKAKNFSQQSSLLSNWLWKLYFPKAPELIYIPIEDITRNVLINVVVKDKNHILYRLLFTQEGWQLIEKYFNGSLGAFSSAHKGSFLFWGIDKKGRRVHLEKQDQKLVGLQGKYCIEKKDIILFLSSGQIYPTTLVCFLVAALYYGLTCLGGFNQVNWLTEIKAKFSQLLEEIGELGLAEDILKRPTQNFAETNLSFLINKDKIFQPTGLDLLFRSNKDWYGTFKELAEKLTLAESLESMLPQIYPVIVPAGQRKKELLTLNDENILQINGGKDKIQSFFEP